MTEVWVRNPYNFHRQTVAEGMCRVAWDRGIVTKMHMDPYKFMELHYGGQYPWEALLIGQQGTAHIDADHKPGNPKAVYPTWSFGEDPEELQQIIEDPVGSHEERCFGDSPDETPVFGQPHRVVIIGGPDPKRIEGKQFYPFLAELQADNPECIIHLHGSYSTRTMFGFGFGSADFEPRQSAAGGQVTLPIGRNVPWELLQKHPKWATMLGYKPIELSIPANRCTYNIRSHVWMGLNFQQLSVIPSSTAKALQLVDSDAAIYKPQQGTKIYPVAPKQLGDKFLCDSCSVQLSCSYSRAGAVCAVPGSEPVPLSRYFKTRDSGLILDGLSTLMQTNVHRMERGLADETNEGALNPEVSKIIKTLFDQGVTLAKLVDPGMRDPKLAINVGNNNTTNIINGNPQQAVAAVIRALEAKGIKRDEITPQMVQNLLESMNRHDGDENLAIEGTVISARDEKLR